MLDYQVSNNSTSDILWHFQRNNLCDRFVVNVDSWKLFELINKTMNLISFKI